MSETNAISLFDRCADPLAAIEKLGGFLAKSGMFGCDKMEQGMVIAFACLCERCSPIDIMKKYHIIEGKLSMRADAMLAEFVNRGGKVKWMKSGDDGTEARAVFTDKNGNSQELAFGVEDAKRMKLAFVTKSGQPTNWQKNPGAMCRARLTSKAIRMMDPGCVAGTYTPEEVMDFEINETNLKDVTPPKAQSAPPKQAEAPKADAPKTEAPKGEAAPKQEAPAKTSVSKKPETKQEPAKVEAAAPAEMGEAHAMVAEIVKEAGVEKEALLWLAGNNFIPDGGGIKDMSREDAERVAAKPNIFIRYIQNGQAAKPLVPVK